jgi:hypothetical protein
LSLHNVVVVVPTHFSADGPPFLSAAMSIAKFLPIGNSFPKIGICATVFFSRRIETRLTGRAEAGRGASKIFIWNRRKSLKSPDSDE